MLSIRNVASENNIVTPFSVRNNIMPIGKNGYNSVRKQLIWLVNNNRVFKFTSSDIKVKVPARSPIGAPPSRTKSFVMSASSDYKHSSPFYQHIYYRSNGITDTKKIEKTNTIGPGLKYNWKLKNKNTFPVTGRVAEMKFSLLVKRKSDYEISAPKFSHVYKKARKRFFLHFFHKGMIAQDYRPSTNSLKFADQPLYMGQALIFFSTEIDIFTMHQQFDEVKRNFTHIETILNVIDTKLSDSSSDGYIIRDSITGKDDPLLTRTYNKVESDYQSGRNNEISIDNYIGLMVGLFHVANHLSRNNDYSRNLSKKAAELIRNFFDA